MINFWGYFNVIVYFFVVPLLAMVVLDSIWPSVIYLALPWTLEQARKP